MKLHLGCGKRFIPGFVHIDLADFSHIDHRHDIRTLPMIGSESADLIYACHVLEYFDRAEVTDVVREWTRTLKPGGIMRLAVPDFEALTCVYQRTGDISKILGPLFGRWQAPGADLVLYHRTVYDFTSLSVVLQSAGLGAVSRYNWRETEHKDYDDYSQAYFPHMDKEGGLLISLNVEATKTPAQATSVD